MGFAFLSRNKCGYVIDCHSYLDPKVVQVQNRNEKPES